MNKLIISKKDLAYNIQKIKEHAKTNLPDDAGNLVKIIAVVKANAYGLDMKQYVQFLIDQGIDFFAVSTIQEAMKFRNLGFTQRLLMLSSTAIKEEVEQLVEKNIIITIGSEEAVEVVNQVAKNAKKPIKVHLKIDTGFGRYGFIYSEREKMIKALKNLKNVEIEGTFTHFSNAFYDDKYTKEQFKRFIDCVEVLSMNEINTGILHVCNSSAFIKFPEMHLNAVRVGSAFTGRVSFQNSLGLKKIANLKTQVIEIKKLPKGYNIGYSNSYTTKKEMTVAILPCGYIDGYGVEVGRDMFRPVDKLRYVLNDIKAIFKKQAKEITIAGESCEILGRIGTFHVVADITGKGVHIGDEAILPINPTLVNPEIIREYE